MPPRPRRKHIVLVVVDDVGLGDTSLNVYSTIPTENIQRLADEGVVLSQYYTQTVCSPSRAALLTGLFPFRMGMQHPETVLPGMAAGIPLAIRTLPEILAEQGYERHAVGKWHVGYGTWSHTPMGRGFQSYVGYLQAQGNYLSHQVDVPEFKKVDGLDFWRDKRPYREAVGNHSMAVFRSRQLEVVQDYAARHPTRQDKLAEPLFLYVAHQSVHVPIMPRSANDERCAGIASGTPASLPATRTRHAYCALLLDMDDAIGDLTQALVDHDMWNDTLVLLTTDNGAMTNYVSDANTGEPLFPASAGSNYPFRGGKMTLFEGGVRALGIVSGGAVPAHARGVTFSGLTHIVDLAAVALAHADVSRATLRELDMDGVDFTRALFASESGCRAACRARGRDHVPLNIVNGGKDYTAVRFGKWKLILNAHKTPRGAWFDVNGNVLRPAPRNESAVLLFDVMADPSEMRDVSAANPDVVRAGESLIRSYVASSRARARATVAYMEPQSSWWYAARALPAFHHGVWAPFMSEKEWSEEFWEPHIAKSVLSVGGGGSDAGVFRDVVVA